MEEEIGVWDSVLIENLSEDNFISNIHQRYKRDHIYTYIGTSVVAVNPYRYLFQYTTDLIRTYGNKGIFQLPPHIYGLANLAYQSLKDQSEDQCVFFSGESGSGKSESFKMVVKFLTQIQDNKNVHIYAMDPNRHRKSSSLVPFESCSPKRQSSMVLSASIEKPTCILKTRSESTDRTFKKSAREKVVEFDFTRHKSTENLPTSSVMNYHVQQSHKDVKTVQPKSCFKSIRPEVTMTAAFNKPTELNDPYKLKGLGESGKLNGCDKEFILKHTENCHKCIKIVCSNHKANKRFYNVMVDNQSMWHHPIENGLKGCCVSNSITSIPSVCNSKHRDEKIYNSSASLTRQNSGTQTTSTPNFSKPPSRVSLYDAYQYDKVPISKSENVNSNGTFNHQHLDSIKSQKLRERVACADVFLEAMGSASTTKNSNSSRYGKFIDIEIDFKGDPVGLHISHYMLEKTRITQSNPGERSFHIFYQLLLGSDLQFLKSLKLFRNVEKYEILKNTSASDEDKHNFIYTKKSLEILGLTSDEICSIFRIIAAILKLGNFIFVPVTNIDGTEGCQVSNDYELHETAQLLHIDVRIFLDCLTRSNSIRGNDDNELDARQASSYRNTLCRTLYSRLFTWLVNKVNEILKSNQREKNLALLDFYGFENLENNLFEQFAINYSNEKLHQNFLQTVLKLEQDQYVREGLEWSRIEFFDNESICELIDKPNYGILSLVNESHLNTDEALLARIQQCCAGHPNFLTSGPSLTSKCFKIRHYANGVNYSINGFLEKNSDILPKNISLGLYQSRLPLVQHLFPEGNPKRTSKKPTTFSTNLRIQLQTLLSIIRNRRSHYVFCIRPNETRQPRLFELPLVQHQVRYMSLMPLVNLCRAGHCFHLTHVKFFDRYKLLNSITWPHYRHGSIIEGIALIIRSVPLPSAEFTIGAKQVFIRSPRTIYELEDFRKSRLHDLAILIQKNFRKFVKRKQFLRMRKSQIIISSAWRTWRAREEYRAMKYEKQIMWAVSVIIKYYRKWKNFQYFLTLPLRLPPNTLSPLSMEWPTAPTFLIETSNILRNIYHRWKCYIYRKSFDQISRNRMREKVTASIIFKDRKASYPRSVGHPFVGDYVRLRHNLQWKKVSIETNDQYVVFADIINKITRSNGKFVPILLVLSTSSMLLLDQRTLQIKYRVPASEIYRLSLSPYLDDIAVFHVKASEFGRKKGDFVFQTGHVIEIVTKLFLVIQNATATPPEVHISTEFEANFGHQTVVFAFKYGGLTEITQGQPKVSRKGNRMEIVV